MGHYRASEKLSFKYCMYMFVIIDLKGAQDKKNSQSSSLADIKRRCGHAHDITHNY